MFEVHYQGGLGDFYCYMFSPHFTNHSIRRHILLALADPSLIVFHIYSDNPASMEIFTGLGLQCIPHKFSEYKFDTMDPHSILNNKYIFLHPYTSTPIKMWPGATDGTLEKIIDCLIDEFGYYVFLWGRNIPALYFGKDTPVSLEEHCSHKRNMLFNATLEQESSTALNMLSSIYCSDRMICLDSAAMMARGINPDQKVFSLFPDYYREVPDLFTHYYYKGLDGEPNKSVYYNEFTLDILREWMKKEENS